MGTRPELAYVLASLDPAQRSLGTIIGRLRRLRGLTQTELGGTEYSKSYVSAVERNSLMPSPHALEVFARQLEQPLEVFLDLLHDTRKEQGDTTAVTITEVLLRPAESREAQRETLDRVLSQVEALAFATAPDLFPLSLEEVDTLPASLRAHGLLLVGLTALRIGQGAQARQALEAALSLAAPVLHPLILDALGTLCYQEQAYPVAVYYASRALALLAPDLRDQQDSSLQFQVLLHLGEAMAATGASREAMACFEQAAACLSSRQSLDAVRRLEVGWGHTLAAHLFDLAWLPAASRKAVGPAAQDQLYQQATEHFERARLLCQASQDRFEENRLRLVQAQLAGEWFRCHPSSQAEQAEVEEQHAGQQTHLLREAEDDCQQILAQGHEWLRSPAPLPAAATALLISALCLLIEIRARRAALARREERAGGQQELSDAVDLCQRLLQVWSEEALPVSVVEQGLTLPRPLPADALLPRLAAAQTPPGTLFAPLSNQLALVLAMGDVAEELGRRATEPAQARACYQEADHCFQLATEWTRLLIQRGEDPLRSLPRSVQRWIGVLRERAADVPTLREESSAQVLVLLQEALVQDAGYAAGKAT